MITELIETTKIRVWLKRINQLIHEVNMKNYSWDTISVANQVSYTFNMDSYIEMPINAEYVVYYSGLELDKADYTISGNTLTFSSAPEENGCPIRVRYLRNLDNEN